MNFETLHLNDLDDGLWELVLDRPPANALSKQMAFELRQVASRLSGSLPVRALLVRGEGRVFFGGGDLVEMQSEGDAVPSNLHEMTIDFHGALSRLARLDAPVVGAITGTAGGAGMSMVAALDLVVAGESARFTMGYTAAGLSPDGTSSFFLSRVVGLRRVTGSRPDAPIPLGDQLLVAERFVGAVAPLAPHALVEHLCEGLRQPVGQRLGHD